MRTRSQAKKVAIIVFTVLCTLLCFVYAPAWIVWHVREGTFYWTPIVIWWLGWRLRGLGVVAELHRRVVHEGFQTYPGIRLFFQGLANAAAQGIPPEWRADHEDHHRFADKPGLDPHTPKDGFWNAHWFWSWQYLSPNYLATRRYLLRDRVMEIASTQSWFWFWIVVPIAYGGIFAGLDGVLWSFASVGWVYHITWGVNSLSHVWGTQPYETGDESRNNLLVAYLTGGEWHNNHHAFPKSPRQGLAWWQVDYAWYVIWILWKLHLAWGIEENLPSKEDMARKRKSPGHLQAASAV